MWHFVSPSPLKVSRIIWMESYNIDINIDWTIIVILKKKKIVYVNFETYVFRIKTQNIVPSKCDIN